MRARILEAKGIRESAVKAKGRITGPVRPLIDSSDQLEQTRLVARAEIVLEFR
jgi:hypothetical protein